MEVYTIDNDGYIVGIKTVKNGYKLESNDILGLAPFEINFHHETGLEKPKSQLEIDAERIEELKELISNKKLLDMVCTEEQDELKILLGL